MSIRIREGWIGTGKQYHSKRHGKLAVINHLAWLREHLSKLS